MRINDTYITFGAKELKEMRFPATSQGEHAQRLVWANLTNNPFHTP